MFRFKLLLFFCVFCPLQGDRFAKWPDADEGNGLLNVVNVICQPVLIYMEAVLTPVDIMPAIATAINNAVMDAWNNIVVPEYINDDDTGHPSDYSFSKLLEQAGHCAALLEYAIGLSDDDDEADIIRYKNLIAIHERCISSCSWDYNHETYVASYSLWDGSPNYATKKVWYKNKTLTDSAIANRRASISQYRSKITQCEANVRAKKQREAEEKRRQQEEERRRKEQEQRERNEAYCVASTSVPIRSSIIGCGSSGANLIALRKQFIASLSLILPNDDCQPADCPLSIHAS